MVSEDTELTSSHGHTKSIATYGKIPFEKDVETKQFFRSRR